MSDAPNGRPAVGLIESVGKWVALAGSVIALGQAGTSWVNGYWTDQAAQRKAAQELALSEIKERSALASEYLKLIIAKDTAPTEKVTLLDALASIEKHPLQQWARERHGSYKRLLERSEAAFQAQRRATEEKEGAEREEAALRAEIERLTVEAELVRDDAVKREEFRKEILERAGLLANVSARVSVTRLTFEGSRTTLAQVQQSLTLVQTVAVRPAAGPEQRPGSTTGGPPSDPPSAAEPETAPVAVSVAQTSAYGLVSSINEITGKVVPEMLARFFPASARANIDVAAPYLRAALQEFQVTDRRMIAAIIATIAVETPRFDSYEEPVSQGAKYDGRLGNMQEGDGVRFRGRGYVGLTGRTNYTAMSTRLGLGSRLVVSPEDAATPEIACRILVAWFVDRQSNLRPVLERGELGQARRIVSGSATRDIERFTASYNQVLAAL